MFLQGAATCNFANELLPILLGLPVNQHQTAPRASQPSSITGFLETHFLCLPLATQPLQVPATLTASLSGCRGAGHAPWMRGFRGSIFLRTVGRRKYSLHGPPPMATPVRWVPATSDCHCCHLCQLSPSDRAAVTNASRMLGPELQWDSNLTSSPRSDHTCLPVTTLPVRARVTRCHITELSNSQIFILAAAIRPHDHLKRGLV